MNEATAIPQPKPDIKYIENRFIPGPEGEVPIRIYTPEGERPFSLLVFFHGGGFVLGNLDTHDIVCRRIAHDSGCKVLSVDYRLAPEHPYPAALEDCYAAVEWTEAHVTELNGDAARLFVGGDSAGGNLAAVVALKARDEGGPRIAKQLLIYPVTDTNEAYYPSRKENATGYLLSIDDMNFFNQAYVPSGTSAADPYVSPMQAERLDNLPDSLVLTMEYDPLRDEGEAYAERMKESGVPVEMKRYGGMVHGVFQFPLHIEEIRDIFKRISTFLRKPV
nr:alpha/beta hydrolase [Thalassobacillus sp. CUG 92003]